MSIAWTPPKNLPLPVTWPHSDMATYKRNNPGNIRYNPAIQWKGQIGQEGGFVVFDSAQNGMRAMALLLSNYYRSGFNTIERIVNRYAPATDGNDTNTYTKFLAKKTGINPTAPIPPTDMPALATYMVQVEQGSYPGDSALQSFKYLFLSFLNPQAAQAATLAGVAVVIGIGLLLLPKQKQALYSQ